MSAPTRGRGPSRGIGPLLLPALMIGAFLLTCAVWAALRLAGLLTGADYTAGRDPVAAVTAVVTGEAPWPAAATVVAAGLGVVLAGVAVLAGQRGARRRARGSRVDVAARHMGRSGQIAPLTLAAARATATRLQAPVDPPGLAIGTTVADATTVTTTWEDQVAIAAGPRTTKSSAYAIPFVLASPGPALATSNKRDVVDATRDLRARFGRVWVFDPQRIAEEAAAWWWNPLSYLMDAVHSLDGRPVLDAFGRPVRRPSEDKAARLVEAFADAAGDPEAKKDAFFDPEGRNLLKSLLLAAAADERPITHVYAWLVDPSDTTAARILAAHGYAGPELQVRAVMSSPDKQRQGVYATARGLVRFLEFPKVTAWCCPMIGRTGTPQPADRVPAPGEHDPAGRPQFDPEQFVRSRDTLYPLSKEGGGSGAPILTALTAAVCEAADEYATSIGGRLRAPMVVVLDEAANICRWRELPNLYSHYGSRGIILVTIVQSPDQGAEAWGVKGWNKLWSAANVRIYGGGIDDAKWLEDRSKIIGEYEYVERSVSDSRTGGSTSTSHRRELILSAADLAALPKGRAIVFASGARPTLIRTQRWMDGPHADAIRASIRAHNTRSDDVLAAEAAEHAEIDALEAAA